MSEIGWFVTNLEGRPVFFGSRADRPGLESTNEWVTDPKPDPPHRSADEYYWKNNSWVIQKDVFKLTDDQRINRVFTTTDKDSVLFEALFELTNEVQLLKNQSAITRAEFKTALKDKLP